MWMVLIFYGKNMLVLHLFHDKILELFSNQIAEAIVKTHLVSLETQLNRKDGKLIFVKLKGLTD